MSKMIQIRNVPDEMHATLKSRAALAGMSLSEYLLAELRRVAERPSREDLLQRFREAETMHVTPSPAEIIREERDNR